MRQLIIWCGLFAVACTQSAPPPTTVRYDAGLPYPYSYPDGGLTPPPGSGVRNPCGGGVPLMQAPGTACGVCNSGQWQCNGPDAVTCMGERRDMQNACGGCVRLVSEPNTTCTGGGRWQCNGRDNVVCSTAPLDGGVGGVGRNACGGTRRLEFEVGSGCGPCELGTWTCDSQDAILCDGLPTFSSEVSDSGWVSPSSTYPGSDEDYGVDGNRGTSWFAAGANGSRATYKWSNLFPACIDHVSVLSNAENYDAQLRSGYGFGRMRVSVLDFWGFELWSREASLPGSPDPDVSLDTGGVYGYSVELELLDAESRERGGFGELIVTALK